MLLHRLDRHCPRTRSVCSDTDPNRDTHLYGYAPIPNPYIHSSDRNRHCHQHPDSYPYANEYPHQHDHCHHIPAAFVHSLVDLDTFPHSLANTFVDAQSHKHTDYTDNYTYSHDH